MLSSFNDWIQQKGHKGSREARMVEIGCDAMLGSPQYGSLLPPDD